MLHVHRAERADRLADGLADTLRAPLEDPFTPDVVAVPTRGIERWLEGDHAAASGDSTSPDLRASAQELAADAAGSRLLEAVFGSVLGT